VTSGAGNAAPQDGEGIDGRDPRQPDRATTPLRCPADGPVRTLKGHRVTERPDACAALARRLGEPLPGTAPVATGWVLVEDPGPWGRDALTEGTLPPAAVERLATGLEGVPIRYQAIRRPDRARPGERTVLLVHGGATPWARRLRLPPDRLHEVDPTVTLSAVPPDVGDPHHDPVVLVCTHAKRDACCAERGGHVARAVAGLEHAATWETSHTGGHRFAPSVILLPTGAVYGFMDEVTTLAAVAAVRDGRLSLDGFRGRAAWERHVQAAEVWVRQQHDLTGLHDVLVEETIVEGDVALVRLRVPDDVMTVRVRRTDLPARPVSCGAEPKVPDSWAVVDRVR
jgi:hypothetical protein